MVASPRVVAPGVYYQELDLSQYIRMLSDTIIGVVTTATKGPLDDKTLCTTVTELESKFGLASETHPGLIVASRFLESGGSTAWIVRVGKTPALASVEIDCVDGNSSFELPAKEMGSYFNDLDFPVSHSTQRTKSENFNWSLTSSGPDSLSSSLTQKPIVPGSLIIKDGATQIAHDDGAGALVFETGVTGYSAGTVNYNTGAVAATCTAHGSTETKSITFEYSYFSAFTLQVVQKLKDKDGNIIQRKVLETFYGMTLESMMTDLLNSSYVEPPEDQPTSLPVADVYEMSGGDDGLTGITDAHFIGNTIGSIPTGLQIFAQDVDVNEVFIPGRTSAGIRQALIQLAESRQDIMTPLDTPSNVDVEGVISWANATGAYSSYGVLESNRAAAYYPWYSSTNRNTADIMLTPPTAAIAEVLGRTDWWQAPAGPDQGRLRNALDTQVKLSPGDRQLLAQNRINPIGNLANLGIQILGQQTATNFATSLDRVGARRALLRIEKSISTAMYPFLFKPNTKETWEAIESLVQPYLDSLAAQGRIYEGRIYCNEKTNTKQVVENSMLSAVVILSLLKFAEKIMLTFETVSYGTKITEELIAKNIVGL